MGNRQSCASITFCANGLEKTQKSDMYVAYYGQDENKITTKHNKKLQSFDSESLVGSKNHSPE